MNVTVIGMGKIGLPLAVAIAEAGHRVYGVDISAGRRHEIVAATADPGELDLATRLNRVLKSDALQVTGDMASVMISDVVLVIIPVGLDSTYRPDLAQLLDLVAEVANAVPKGALVVFETTLPVGTTRSLLAPILGSQSGYRIGSELYVAYSPERVFSGRVFSDLGRYPKLVGGVDIVSGQRAKAFYETFLVFEERPDLRVPNGVWLMTSSDAAEFAKLAETTYRDVNIALANEFARYSDSVGIDVYEVISAANSQPFSHLHTPGASVGGHCIPVYPHFYLHGNQGATLPSEARRTNSDMPGYVVELLADLAGPLTGRRVAILGATYRGGVKEVSNSGTLALKVELEQRGAEVLCHDPLLSASEMSELGLRTFDFPTPVHGMILHTDHEQYKSLQENDLPGVRVVIDGRNHLNPAMWPNTIFKAIGRPAELRDRER